MSVLFFMKWLDFVSVHFVVVLVSAGKESGRETENVHSIKHKQMPPIKCQTWQFACCCWIWLSIFVGITHYHFLCISGYAPNVRLPRYHHLRLTLTSFLCDMHSSDSRFGRLNALIYLFVHFFGYKLTKPFEFTVEILVFFFSFCVRVKEKTHLFDFT